MYCVFFEEETPYVCFLLPRSNVSFVNLFRFVIFSAPFITSSVCLSIPLCSCLPTCLRTYPSACLSVCPFNSNFDCLPNLFVHLCFQSEKSYFKRVLFSKQIRIQLSVDCNFQ